MKLDSLHKLYVMELKDLYSAENQLLAALPKMAAASQHAGLKQAFENHLQETQEQVARLEAIFGRMEFAPGGHRCIAMAGLIEEGEVLLQADCDPQVLDAALIAAAQRIEHYEIAAYGTARAYAEMLGEFTAADLLQQSLNEEGHADQHLTRLAERSINLTAVATA